MACARRLCQGTAQGRTRPWPCPHACWLCQCAHRRIRQTYGMERGRVMDETAQPASAVPSRFEVGACPPLTLLVAFYVTCLRVSPSTKHELRLDATQRTVWRPLSQRSRVGQTGGVSGPVSTHRRTPWHRRRQPVAHCSEISPGSGSPCPIVGSTLLGGSSADDGAAGGREPRSPGSSR